MPDQKAAQAELILLKNKTKDLLATIGFKEDSAIYNRIMERLMLLGEIDIHLLLSIENKIYKKLRKKPG